MIKYSFEEIRGCGRGILYEKPRSFEVANKGVFGFYGAALFMTSFGCVWLRVSLVTMVTINWNLLGKYELESF